MNQKTKNIWLLGTLLVLVLLTVLAYTIDVKKTGLSIDKRSFTLDPETVITDVSITSRDNSLANSFSYQSGSWVLNEQYILDQNMRDIFFSVLSQMEIRRPINEIQKDSIVSFLDSEGIGVKIYDNQNLILTYTIAGNESIGQSFVMGEGKIPYEVHLPGYQSYVAGIFDAPETDWRDRFVFNINPISLSHLSVEQEGSDNYDVVYSNNEFSIAHMATDSAALANYMEDVVFLQADAYIELKESPDFKQQFQNETPMLVFTVHDISGNSQSLKLYPILSDNPYVLGIKDDGSACVFQTKRIRSLIRQKDEF